MQKVSALSLVKWLSGVYLTLCDPVDCSPPGFSVGVFGQEYHSGLPFPPLGDLDPGAEPESPASPALTGRFFTTEPPGFQERPFVSSQLWGVPQGLHLMA